MSHTIILSCLHLCVYVWVYGKEVFIQFFLFIVNICARERVWLCMLCTAFQRTVCHKFHFYFDIVWAGLSIWHTKTQTPTPMYNWICYGDKIGMCIEISDTHTHHESHESNKWISLEEEGKNEFYIIHIRNDAHCTSHKSLFRHSRRCKVWGHCTWIVNSL